MRTLSLVFALLCLFVGQLFAGYVLDWDKNADSDRVTLYRVWVAQGTNAFEVMGSTTTNKFPLPKLNKGVYQFQITAVNVDGESIPSDPTPWTVAEPSKPKNLRITLELTIP